jgi:ribose/xylose/arabinose/galactoside ABC-type transport system permease subunit
VAATSEPTKTSPLASRRSVLRRLLLAQESGLVLVIAMMMALLTAFADEKPVRTMVALPPGATTSVQAGQPSETITINGATPEFVRSLSAVASKSPTGTLRVDVGGAVTTFAVSDVRVIEGDKPSIRVETRVNKFLNLENLMLNLVYASFIAVMAVGMTAIIALSGIDLSVGSIYALAALFGAIFLRYDWSQGLPGVTVSGSKGLWSAAVAGGFVAIAAGFVLRSRTGSGGGGGGSGVGKDSGGNDLKVQKLTNVMLAVGAVLLLIAFSRLAGVLKEAGDNQTARSALSGAVAVPLGIAVTCLVGAACGLFNGVMMVGLRVHPFIITLGTMAAYRGLVAIPTQAQSVGSFPDSFTKGFFKLVVGGDGALGTGVNPMPVAFMLLAAIVGTIVLSRTVLGRRIYAIGGNETAARYAGIPVGRVKIVVHTVMGALAGLSACLYLGYFGAAETNAGNGYELKVIAATVIGGASLSGGKGTAAGAVLGAILIQLIDNGMVILNVDQNYNQIVMGAAIVLAVLLDQLKSRLMPQGR